MKKRQLKWSMIVILVACWFIPLSLLSITMLFLISSKVDRQIKNTIETSADKAIEICQLRIAEAMTASKQASYDSTIRDSYEQYLEDGNETLLRQTVTLYLAQQYKYNKDFKSTILYFVEEPDTLYFTFSNIAGSTYGSVKEFEIYAKETIQEAAPGLDTYLTFMQVNGRIYMVRNLVNSQFEPYGVLVVELNPQEILSSLESVWGYQRAEVFVDGIPLLGGAWTGLDQSVILPSSYVDNGKEPYVYKLDECDRHQMSYRIMLDREQIRYETYTIRIMAGIFCVFMIPLVVIVFYFFHKKVTKPIEQLVQAYEEIEQEHYGYHIEEKDVEEEFYYLNEAFNRMSDKLQYQFQKIYVEELALRDANIMALQSQINPHFLNNTLEVINWEARMEGNYKVSGMIEALSVMLEATMNRRRESASSLAEELNYVDAYLYIIKERYGENFEVIKQVDETLLRVEVPRLIIQPIVENAVEHGMDLRKKGRVRLSIFREGDFLHIEVWDNGTLSKENREKIERLLSQEDTTDLKHVSLGIRNVNKRLKITYGNECGLTITNDENNYTVSRLLIKL